MKTSDLIIYHLVLIVGTVTALNLTVEKKNVYDALALDNFREYLRIPSVQPDIDYTKCVDFLRKQALSLNLPIKVIGPVPKKPIVIITWKGKKPSLPSILLNSHMDVVFADINKWKHDPFGAVMEENGNIYGRGTQDMKIVGIQYLEAIRRLKENGVKIQRTIYCIFVPDEEIGGANGTGAFIKTNEFSEMNVGLTLNEGGANANNEFYLINGEKCMWNLIFHCPGTTGHSSMLFKNTAGEKLNKLLDKIYEFRNQQVKLLEDNPNLAIGDVTTVNVAKLEGGVQFNVLPSEFLVYMDCRIPVTVNLTEFEELINNWCKEAGDGVWFEKKHFDTIVTPSNVRTEPFWMKLKEVMDSLNYKLNVQITPGITDNRFIRQLGIPAFGFSLINNTPNLAHADNEYIHRDTFLNGIEIYTHLLPALAEKFPKKSHC